MYQQTNVGYSGHLCTIGSKQQRMSLKHGNNTSKQIKLTNQYSNFSRLYHNISAEDWLKLVHNNAIQQHKIIGLYTCCR